jgi:hypothetical protein
MTFLLLRMLSLISAVVYCNFAFLMIAKADAGVIFCDSLSGIHDWLADYWTIFLSVVLLAAL